MEFLRRSLNDVLIRRTEHKRFIFKAAAENVRKSRRLLLQEALFLWHEHEVGSSTRVASYSVILSGH
jgi:hypothetical protein